MSICLKPRNELSRGEIESLERAMTAFYQNPPPEYYAQADTSRDRYSPETLPFHCDLVNRIRAGDTVLEVGCGTAHLCPHVEARGGHYTGVDHSSELLAQNQQRHPRARFLPVHQPLPEQFDLVASLYTIEHVVDPPAYLEKLWDRCRPGGLIGIICPDFVNAPVPPPSLFYGHTPRRLREKIRTGSLADVWAHWWDLKVRAPRWQARARRMAPGAFWINLRPRVLHGAAYEIDADAVHAVRLEDLTSYLEQRGGQIVATSRSLPHVPPELLRFNAYVLVRKPPAAADVK